MWVTMYVSLTRNKTTLELHGAVPYLILVVENRILFVLSGFYLYKSSQNHLFLGTHVTICDTHESTHT